MTRKEPALRASLMVRAVRRIAGGSGTQVQDVNRLLKQFMEMQRVMKSMKGASCASNECAERRRWGRPPQASRAGSGSSRVRCGRLSQGRLGAAGKLCHCRGCRTTGPTALWPGLDGTHNRFA